MKFTPAYGVIYHGELHRAGQPFEVDPEDTDGLCAHGTLERAPEVHDPPQKKHGKLVK